MATGKKNIDQFDIMDVSAGCNYSDDPTALTKNQSPDSMNVEFFNGRIRKRPGERAITTVPTTTGTPTSASLLLIGGGGSGGINNGGGGGGGGYLEGTYSIPVGAIIAVTVGSGGGAKTGSSDGESGGSTIFDAATAVGGGGGGIQAGVSGGSGGGAGGGAGGSSSPGASTQGTSGGLTGYGFAGGNAPAVNPFPAGGGGGAGAVGAAGSGSVCGAGGIGKASSISGASVTYAGGGGGGGVGSTGGTGGTGGGGAGTDGGTATSGTANTGGGGGGAGALGSSGAGGSGICIISYVTPALDNGSGGTITHSGGNTIHTFTSSGTFTAPSVTNTSFVGESLVDFSDTKSRHRQVAHIGDAVFAYYQLSNTYDTLRSGAPITRSFNAKVSSYLIQTYSDYSAPYYWDGTTSAMAAVSSNAPGFKRCVEFQGYLLGMNTSSNHTRCYYQIISNILGAGAAYTDYFTLTPAPNDDEITDPFILNGRLYVGTKYSIFRVSFVGGVTVFEFKQVISDIGVVPGTAQTVITKQFGQVVLFLGTDKRMYLFDGANVKTISDLFYYHNKTTPISLDLIDDSYKENSFAVYDVTRRIYRLCVTKKGQTTNYYGLNVDVDTFAYYPFDNMEFSAGAVCYDDLLRPFVIYLDYVGLLHKMFIDNPTDNGTAINEYYITPLVSKVGSTPIKSVSNLTLHMLPVSHANLDVYQKVDFRRAWEYLQAIPLASSRDKFLGQSLVLGSGVLGSEKDAIFPQVGVSTTCNDLQFKFVCDTPTAAPWEIYDIEVNQDVLTYGRAEAQR